MKEFHLRDRVTKVVVRETSIKAWRYCGTLVLNIGNISDFFTIHLLNHFYLFSIRTTTIRN